MNSQDQMQDIIDRSRGHKSEPVPNLRVGTYAYATTVAGRLGKVTKVFQHNGETLHHLHYFDRSTGKLMECPDLRCDSKRTTCPIHGANLRRRDITPMTPRDIRYYKLEGFIS